MKKGQAKSANSAELRRQAEARLKAGQSPKVSARSAQDSARLLHELQVHQIELEMQNEELRHSRAEVETGLARYTDLYDFAPVGYLTLDRAGAIHEANLAGAAILGTQRAALMGRRLGLFVAETDWAVFSAFLVKVFVTQACASCEVALLTEQNPPPQVRIDVTPAAGGQECRAMLTDITQRKLSDERLQSLALELSLAEERERKRLATSLHDDLSQILTVIKIRLSILRQPGIDADDSSGRAGDAVGAAGAGGAAGAVGAVGSASDLKNIETLVDRAIASARSLTLQLSHPALYDLGFVAGAEWLVEDIQKLYGLKVNLSRITGLVPMDLRVRVVLFQCLRELLVNAAKHAHVGEAKVQIARRRQMIRVTVQDHGIGFRPDTPNVQAPAGSGFGLFSIRERLHNLGGRLRLRSIVGKGTTVVLEVPAGPEDLQGVQ